MSSTAERILDVAQRLVQSRGWSAFSYADVAEALHIKKASVHHHFRTKGELGRRLVERYRLRFAEELARIGAASGGEGAKLKSYVALYRSVLRDDNKMCLCGMFAADFSTLPRPVREEVKRFFSENEEWLTKTLGKKRRTDARLMVAALEGAMLVARTHEAPEQFDAMARRLLESLRVE
jgi:TetR/AcrR family transcriptional regulator, transcriptional repressor for nem operon